MSTPADVNHALVMGVFYPPFFTSCREEHWNPSVLSPTPVMPAYSMPLGVDNTSGLPIETQVPKYKHIARRYGKR